MKNQTLSIEQMHNLQELGVDTSKASMFYVQKLEQKDKYCLLNVEPGNLIPYIPAFTLQDIIELLPPCVKSGSDFYNICLETTRGNWIVYYYRADLEELVSKQSKVLLEAAYEMLCWCAEYGYLK